MKIAVFTPYLDTGGGGEKYMLTLASHLAEKESVDLLLDSHLQTLKITEVLDRVSRLHHLDLSAVKLKNAPIGAGSSLGKRLLFLRDYDVLIALTDGSIFPNTAKKGYLHFQVPFENKHPSLVQNLKLKTWKGAIFNSRFTKSIVEKTWPIQGEVIYPPVSLQFLKSGNKQKQILSVGRFFGFLKDKKQAFMINAFKKLISQLKEESWSLHLAGAAGDGDVEYIESLKKLADGSKIYFYPNIPFNKLVELYAKSSIYWHAMGYEETDPTKFEHFGITTVEAMASGVVPVVINKGGQKEIVDNGINGFLWEREDELIDKTLDLIHNQKKLHELSQNAIKKSLDFSEKKFYQAIDQLIYG